MKMSRPSGRRIGVICVLAVLVALPAVIMGPLRQSSESSVDAASYAEAGPQIRRLYLAYFQREPDPVGWPFWLDHRAQGRSLNWVSDRFAESEEFMVRYGSLSDDDFVRLVYRNVLGRTPDPTGWDGWRAVLRRGGSRGQVMVGFSESSEFINKTAPATTGPAAPLPVTPAPAPPAPAPAPQEPSAPAPPNQGMPSGMMVWDETSLPPQAVGYSGPRITSTNGTSGETPFRQPHDDTAAFRVNCSISHMNYDDPIVFPGVRGATHLHGFYGNVGTDYRSTPSSIAGSGNSTCTGGTINRTAYWAPAVIDTATKRAVTPPPPSSSYNVDRDHALQVYYKSGYEGVRPQTIQNFPPGLRMIAGTSSSTAPQPLRVVHYSCDLGQESSSFPNCAPGQIFTMSIVFPQCWDGVNLDSADHKSHMAYGLGYPDKGCPSSHPVPLPQVTQNYRLRVPPGGMSTWRLASDLYTGPAGYSGHADWMNGWDASVFQRALDTCYPGGLDCQMNLIGGGQKLY